jgi:hypothetical protein
MAKVLKKKKPPLGTGERFRNLTKKTGSKALAAWIGRKKYGKKRFQQLATRGKRTKIS